MKYHIALDIEYINIYTEATVKRVMSYVNCDGKRIPTNNTISRSGSIVYTFWVNGPYARGTLCNAFLWAHAIDETAVIGDVLLAFEHITEVELLESLSILSALGYSHVPAEQK